MEETPDEKATREAAERARPAPPMSLTASTEPPLSPDVLAVMARVRQEAGIDTAEKLRAEKIRGDQGSIGSVAPVSITAPTLTGEEKNAQLAYTQLGQQPKPVVELTPEQKQQAQLEAMRAQIMGMRAPSVGMNKYQIRGFEGQQGALGEQISAMNAGQPDIDAARAGM